MVALGVQFGPGLLRISTLFGLGETVTPAVVDINTELGYQSAQGAGTGIVLTADGEVLTNNHVINGATAIRVTDLGNGRRYVADVLGYDRSNDLAVLRLRGAAGLATAALGDSSAVAVGDPISAIGNAGGEGGAQVASGTVSALDRSVSATDQLTGSTEPLTGLIEVAADVVPGDSGGPLVDQNGRVIGVDTAASENYRYQTSGGSGFAIPINRAMTVFHQIVAGQSSDTVHVGPTGILGVSVLSGGLGSSPSAGNDLIGGAPVAEVLSGSPADQAGLGPGDIIVGLDGQAVDSATTLTNLLGRHHPGDRINLHWLDVGGTRRAAIATLAVGPPA